MARQPAERAGAVGVVTPEAVALALEPATVGSRGVARLLDLVIVGALSFAIGVVGATLDLLGWLPGWAGTVTVLLLGFAVQLGYPIAFESLWHGRTPGKAAMGLRVVTVEGAPAGFRHAAIRAAVGLFELMATFGIVAILTSLASERGRRLGDLAAGTLVIRERQAAARPTAHTFAPPPELAAYAARVDASRIGPAEYAAIRDTLLRGPSLAPASRQRVAAAVAEALLPRVSPPPPPGTGPEAWLACVAAAVQARGRGGAAAGPAPTSVATGSPDPGRGAPPVPPPSRPVQPPREGGFVPPG